MINKLSKMAHTYINVFYVKTDQHSCCKITFLKDVKHKEGDSIINIKIVLFSQQMIFLLKVLKILSGVKIQLKLYITCTYLCHYHL